MLGGVYLLAVDGDHFIMLFLLDVSEFLLDPVPRNERRWLDEGKRVAISPDLSIRHLGAYEVRQPLRIPKGIFPHGIEDVCLVCGKWNRRDRRTRRGRQNDLGGGLAGRRGRCRLLGFDLKQGSGNKNDECEKRSA